MTSVDVPPQSGRGVRVPRSAFLTVVDVGGTQIADLFAFNAEDAGEWLSVGHSRIATDRLFPDEDQAFWSNRMRPMLTLVEDRSPGIHDTLCAPCDSHLYRWLGASDDHPSCRDNALRALADAALRPVDLPPSVNLFQQTPVAAGGVMSVHPAVSRAGDSITFRAELDILAVVTSCSMDFWGVNGERCTPIKVTVAQQLANVAGPAESTA